MLRTWVKYFIVTEEVTFLHFYGLKDLIGRLGPQPTLSEMLYLGHDLRVTSSDPAWDLFEEALSIFIYLGEAISTLVDLTWPLPEIV